MTRVSLVFAIAVTLLAVPLFAATIVVNSNADIIAPDGQCTLREAITSANTNTAVGGCTAGTAGVDTIAFAIGTGAQTIALTSDLPSITEPVILDGTTQPGYAGTPLVTISGGNARPSAFSIASGGSGSTIQGFLLTGFTQAAITITASNNIVRSNSMQNNPGIGVSVLSGTGNLIVRNAMFFNGSLDAVIDLAPSGATPNDPCDADTGANLLQNKPVMTAAIYANNQITLRGSLDSTPNSTFAIDFYYGAPAAFGPTSYIGSTTVVTNASCTATFDVTLPYTPAVASGSVFATATDAGNNTSELSLGVGLATPLQVTKSFAPTAIVRNGTNNTAALTITITYPIASPVPAAPRTISLIDLYPTGIINAATPAAATSCGGTVTAVPGGTSLSLSNGTLAAGSSCSVSVNVTATQDGTFVNDLPAGAVTGTTTNSYTENTQPASATLTVTTAGPPTAAKSFAPSSILLGSTSTMTIRLTNPFTAPITGLSFVDTYPAGLVNANPSNVATTCGGTAAAVNGGTAVSLTGGTLAAGASCTVTVTVLAQNTGSFTNTLPAGSVTGMAGGVPQSNPEPATATLTVTNVGPVSVDKTFTPASITVGEAATLTIRLTNPHTAPLTGISLTDLYPGGLVNATPSNVSTTCGGTATAAAGGSSVALTGGTLAPGTSCTVTVSVVARNSGSLANTIPAGSVTTDQGQTNNVVATGTIVVAPAVPSDIPTASEWMLLALATLLGTIALIRMRIT